MAEIQNEKEIVNVFPSIVTPRKHTVPNTGSKCVDLKKKLVRIRHITKFGDPKAEGTHIAMDHLMDLSALTDEEILESAADARIIKMRPTMKGMKPSDVLKKFTTDYVLKVVNLTKRTKDPVEKLSTGVDKLNFTEHVEFLKINYGLSDKEARAMAMKKFQPEE